MFHRLPIALHEHHCPKCSTLMEPSVLSHDPENGSVVVFYCPHCETEQVVRIPATALVAA